MIFRVLFQVDLKNEATNKFGIGKGGNFLGNKHRLPHGDVEKDPLNPSFLRFIKAVVLCVLIVPLISHYSSSKSQTQVGSSSSYFLLSVTFPFIL